MGQLDTKINSRTLDPVVSYALSEYRTVQHSSATLHLNALFPSWGLLHPEHAQDKLQVEAEAAALALLRGAGSEARAAWENQIFPSSVNSHIPDRTALG